MIDMILIFAIMISGFAVVGYVSAVIVGLFGDLIRYLSDWK